MNFPKYEKCGWGKTSRCISVSTGVRFVNDRNATSTDLPPEYMVDAESGQARFVYGNSVAKLVLQLDPTILCPRLDSDWMLSWSALSRSGFTKVETPESYRGSNPAGWLIFCPGEEENACMFTAYKWNPHTNQMMHQVYHFESTYGMQDFGTWGQGSEGGELMYAVLVILRLDTWRNPYSRKGSDVIR